MKEQIKNWFRIIKANFILLLGTGLFTYGFFNFDSGKHCSGIIEKYSYLDCNYPATFYYYNYLSLILLVAGAIFIVLGLLKIKVEERKD